MTIRSIGQFKYSRNLQNKDLAEEFARDILELGEHEVERAAFDIKKAERLLKSTMNQSSLNTESERVSEFKSNAQREKLHKQIINELFTLQRLDDDDNMKLGSDGGGALPKSEFASLLSDEIEAIIIDSDYAKRKIPEYHVIDAEYSANFVHKESSLLASGRGNNDSLLENLYFWDIYC